MIFAFAPPHQESTQHTARTTQQGLHRLGVCTYVLVVLFPAIIWHRIIRTRNDGPTQRAGQLDFRRTWPTAGAAQSIHRSSTQPQPHMYQQPATLRKPLAFVTATVVMCVLFVYTGCTVVLHVCMTCMGWELDQCCSLCSSAIKSTDSSIEHRACSKTDI